MEEIIKSITEAEQEAERIKAEAVARAAKIVADAEAESLAISSECAAECKFYRDSEISKAEREAEELYQETLGKKKAEVKTYADSVLKEADAASGKIVRRISRGNR